MFIPKKPKKDKPMVISAFGPVSLGHPSKAGCGKHDNRPHRLRTRGAKNRGVKHPLISNRIKYNINPV